jgi:hypothetical protein
MIRCRGFRGIESLDPGTQTDVGTYRTMERRIIGFHRDEDGDWVADLECGHGQHVRHQPPWQVRPWVTTPEGRAEWLGRALECRRCDGAA